MPRLATSVLGSIALVLGLAACSPPTTETPPVDTAVHTDAPAPPDRAADVVIPDGVIGTAELTSASGDNTISGTVVVTAGGGGFDVALKDFHSDVPGGLQLSFSPWSETTTCLADTYRFSFGNLSTDANQTGLSMGPRDLSRGDPSYYLTAVITATAPSTTDPDGCVLTPRAVGTITWDVPDTRPGLLAVDTGARFGAGGATATTDGAPISYRAVAGDTLNDIADRFGITDDDLGFLNPLTSRQLHAGDDLNLRVALRGGASVPPPSA
ncbi:LysM domain-containing protein [Cryobacterium sp. TMT3-29-2]|uniref:LysM peptidoglycan-binding domain-containing protein n=1 Tax=Cryobacterium sp. TMT3-29-2 TaxID=2555867 RepID=UPI00107313DB|nr:LysM domain-containing protein [Cryobacterium sp. TMT3-29-2]TFC82759.1 LysM domain-containing protein [Cryobacterium sp. TMT3-29-2]